MDMDNSRVWIHPDIRGYVCVFVHTGGYNIEREDRTNTDMANIRRGIRIYRANTDHIRQITSISVHIKNTN